MPECRWVGIVHFIWMPRRIGSRVFLLMGADQELLATTFRVSPAVFLSSVEGNLCNTSMTSQEVIAACVP
ncbi:hypothetical protein Spb1_07830 [Planctopirus ephydatiae]|jgi:hypothetical protein|uniref:Uncharacterized protein n=1 Tax=Planctopirus ephydatiae TaxID=2528019 RepID=A0A518GK23_9PLAN|nr:hypothetical protein Spb1_07830 [Planctopirus ephydatiae]